uniref:Uncharacterized protein n=1 Tax=Sinorhizobium meliloti (strain SM11) TaxID=707241 RepID=A4KVP3_SINMM|nr:hypothetical protein [Sinorhizobium meliloti SM11]
MMLGGPPPGHGSIRDANEARKPSSPIRVTILPRIIKALIIDQYPR